MRKSFNQPWWFLQVSHLLKAVVTVELPPQIQYYKHRSVWNMKRIIQIQFCVNVLYIMSVKHYM